MIANPNLVFFACIAKGTTILAEFNSKDAELGALALKCLEKTPPLHSAFSHTIRNKTYMFLMDDPFVYFGIFDENLENSECLSFLMTVKDSFNEVVAVETNSVEPRLDHLNSHCFQGEFNPVFHQLLASPSEFDVPHSPRVALKHDRSGSVDSSREKKIGSMPLLGDASKFLKKKKKKRLLFGKTNGEGKAVLKENKFDVSDHDGVAVGLSREFSVIMHRNGLFAGDAVAVHQKAKRVWKKQLWVVLTLDLIVCCILFAIWLWICGGFKCIAG